MALSPRRRSWRAAPRVRVGRAPREVARRSRVLLPRSYLISTLPRREAPRLSRRLPARVFRAAVSQPLRIFPRLIRLPLGGAFALARSVKRDVCVSKQSRREVLFSKGVGGSSWRNRIDMRGAHHDGKRC